MPHKALRLLLLLSFLVSPSLCTTVIFETNISFYINLLDKVILQDVIPNCEKVLSGLLPPSSSHLDACLDVLAVDPADDLGLLDASWSPCLMSAPLGEMEKARRR